MDRRVILAIRLLAALAHSKAPVRKIAGRLGLSVSHVQHLVRAETGT